LIIGSVYVVDVCKLPHHRDQSCVTSSCAKNAVGVTLQCTATVDGVGLNKTSSSVNVTVYVEPCVAYYGTSRSTCNSCRHASQHRDNSCLLVHVYVSREYATTLPVLLCSRWSY